jgi:hypothetical protein
VKQLLARSLPVTFGKQPAINQGGQKKKLWRDSTVKEAAGDALGSSTISAGTGSISA